MAEQEHYEVGICQQYMPEALSEDELIALVDQAIATTGAASMKDMGKVMGEVKPKAQGRADMGAVSKMVKARLAG